MPDRVEIVKELAKSISVDLASIVGFLVAMLPAIQNALGVLIALVILLINLKRYKNISKPSKDEESEKKQEKKS